LQNEVSRRLINQCVHCGFCLPACPTYQLWAEEPDSPRGRIYLMKLIGDGELVMNASAARHFEQCLSCRACEPACPSGVEYGRLIEAARHDVASARAGLNGSVRRWLPLVLSSPRLLRVSRWALRLSAILGIRRLLGRAAGTLSPQLRALDGLAPERVAPRWQAPITVPAKGVRRGRAGLLLGCVQREFFPDVNRATAELLAADGWEVVVPDGQGCCGALAIHSGLDGREYARDLIDVFERADIDVLITNAAGCGSAIKEYGRLLADDPAFEERASGLASMCRDLTEVLDPQASRGTMPIRVALQSPCHLHYAQGISDQPRALLAKVEGLELVEVRWGSTCCGSAGLYNVVEPAAAERIGERYVADVLVCQPDVIVTTNPGCQLQMERALRAARSTVRCQHLALMLLAAAESHSDG
jgi:glycolate oxidase iron-sulfur subunit